MRAIETEAITYEQFAEQHIRDDLLIVRNEIPRPYNRARIPKYETVETRYVSAVLLEPNYNISAINDRMRQLSQPANVHYMQMGYDPEAQMLYPGRFTLHEEIGSVTVRANVVYDEDEFEIENNFGLRRETELSVYPFQSAFVGSGILPIRDRKIHRQLKRNRY